MIKIRNVKFLLWFHIEGIVIYPFILFSREFPDLDIENHERIHWDQIKCDGFFGFYWRYLREYFQGRLSGLSHDEAYRKISYEEEAYKHQGDHLYAVKNRNN